MPEAGFKVISTVHSDESKPNRWQLREINVNFHFRFNKTNFMRAGWGLDNLFEGDAGSYTFLGTQFIICFRWSLHMLWTSNFSPRYTPETNSCICPMGGGTRCTKHIVYKGTTWKWATCPLKTTWLTLTNKILWERKNKPGKNYIQHDESVTVL